MYRNPEYPGRASCHVVSSHFDCHGISSLIIVLAYLPTDRRQESKDGSQSVTACAVESGKPQSKFHFKMMFRPRSLVLLLFLLLFLVQLAKAADEIGVRALLNEGSLTAESQCGASEFEAVKAAIQDHLGASSNRMRSLQAVNCTYRWISKESSSNFLLL